jgi:predicted extracellular nuclease
LTLVAALLLAITVLPAAIAGADSHLGACGDPHTPIYEIQGTGYSTSFDGDRVITEGIVTADFQEDDELGGFFVQDPFGDGKRRTSDGVFVYHKSYWDYDVSVGDHIRFEAEADEYYGQTQLKNMGEGDLIFCGTGRIRPTTMPIQRYNRMTESFEGMLLFFPARFQVTDTYNLKYGEVWLAQAGVTETPTNQYPAGDDAAEFGARNMRKVFLLDDGSGESYPDPIPYLRDDGTLRLGDSVRGITGVVGYGYSRYRVHPVEDVVFTKSNPRRDAPPVGGDVVVASANVLNFWTTLGGRGAYNQAEYDVQLAKLVDMLMGTGADILALQEIENNDVTIMALVDALNAAEGADVWAWVGPAPQNVYPIRNEIVYRTDMVIPVGGPVTLAHAAFDTVRPDLPPDPIGRRPLAQTFEYDGEMFTIVVNHLKSKGSPCDSIGDPFVDDGQGNCNLTRVWQAETLLDFVDWLIGETGDPDVLVVGDMNAYLYEDPILMLETELMNLVAMWDGNPYSYNYFNYSDAPWIGRGLLDHALATSSMAAQVNRVKVWHVNADEPRLLDWYDEWITAPGPYRSSDHDPVIIGLDF